MPIVTDKEIFAAAYLRYSAETQNESSIEAQKRKIMEYCDSKNIKITKFYIDRAKSGTSTVNREAFNQMILDSKEKNFQFVIVHKLDRFARSRFDSAINRSKLKANGVSVLSVSENLDGSKESVMLESVIEGMAEYYSLNLSLEVKKGHRERALVGKHNGGHPPYSYEVDPVTRLLVVNNYEAKAIKIIFEMFDEGYGYSEILKELKSKGFKIRNGNDFQKSGMHDILKNSKYRGLFQYNLKAEKDPFGKRNNHAYKSDDEVISIENGCPRIISDELFFRVQKKMAENRHNTGKYKSKENYILSGKIICGECNSRMTGNRRNSGRSKTLYVTYKCNGKAKKNCTNREVNKIYIENFVISQLKAMFFNKKRINELVENVNKYSIDNNSSYDVKILDCKNQINGINKKIGNILTSLEDGVKKASYGSRLEDFEESKKVLLAEIKKLEIQRDVPSITKKQIIQVLRKFRSNALKTPIETKKMISEYVEKVIVYNDRVEVIIKVNRDISDKYLEVS